MLFKEIVDARTDGRTHAQTPDIEGSQKLTEHFVLVSLKHYFQITIFKVIQRWANDQANTFY